VKPRLGVATSSRERRDRLDRAQLVVHPHHAHDGNTLRERGVEGLGVHNPGRGDRDDDLFTAELTDRVGGGEDRFVLDGRDGHAARRAAGAGGERRSDHGQVVGFGASPGEDHVAGFGAHRGGELAPALLDRGARLPAHAVRGRRVAEGLLAQKRQHGLADLGVNRGRGGVIEVDGARRHVGK
jgi:hypothetical protein